MKRLLENSFWMVPEHILRLRGQPTAVVAEATHVDVGTGGIAPSPLLLLQR